MFKLLFGALKLAALAAVVLVLGNLIRWDGRTISDHVRTQMSHAERADLPGKVRDWADEAYEKGKAAMKGSESRATARKEPKVAEYARPEAAGSEDLLRSERQKLRDLIHELNTFKSASN